MSNIQVHVIYPFPLCLSSHCITTVWINAHSTMQPKREKGSSIAEGVNNEIESTLIYEEQPVAACGDGGSGFYYDEGDDYAEYETSANVPTTEHTATFTVVPAPAAPVQVADGMRLRIEANKRAAEARRAAKAAAAAAAELTSPKATDKRSEQYYSRRTISRNRANRS